MIRMTGHGRAPTTVIVNTTAPIICDLVMVEALVRHQQTPKTARHHSKKFIQTNVVDLAKFSL